MKSTVESLQSSFDAFKKKKHTADVDEEKVRRIAAETLRSAFLAIEGGGSGTESGKKSKK